MSSPVDWPVVALDDTRVDEYRRKYELSQDDVRDLTARNDELQERLAQLEAAQADAARSQHTANDDAQVDEYRRKYELAQDDVRDLTARNTELQEQLAELGSRAG